MMNIVDQIDDATVSEQISEGRVSLTVANEPAPLRVSTPDHQPLSAAQPHVELRVSGEDFDATVTLDGEQTDALRDALTHALTWEDQP